jgi:hypothetical protein
VRILRVQLPYLKMTQQQKKVASLIEELKRKLAAKSP